MNTLELWWLILGMAAVTALPRIIPLLVLAGKHMPRAVEIWLGYVPVAVLGALLCASLAAPAGQSGILGFDTVLLLTTILVFAVAVRYRSILLTVGVGMVAVTIVRALM